MSTLKAKELLAEKFDNYMNNKKLGIPVIAGEFYEQDESTVKGSIYNKLFRSQIDMQKLENKYIDEGKEIDITKATKRLKELEKNIEKTKTALNNFSKNYQEELEKLQDQELAQEHSVMGRIKQISLSNVSGHHLIY